MSINMPLEEDYAPTTALVEERSGFEYVDLSETKLDHDAMMLAPGEFALKHQVLPLFTEGAEIGH